MLDSNISKYRAGYFKASFISSIDLVANLTYNEALISKDNIIRFLIFPTSSNKVFDTQQNVKITLEFELHIKASGGKIF